MKKLLIIFLFFFSVYCIGIIEETASFEDFLYKNTQNCQYDNWISHISEGIAEEDYNLYSPWDQQTNGFGEFYITSDDTLQIWSEIVTTFLSGDYQLAQNAINLLNIPYQVAKFNDIDTGRTYYLLREQINMEYYDDNGTAATYDDEEGSFDFGWGLYVYNPQATNPIIVTVPHPNDDFIAPAVAWECFTNWDAMFFLIAGAGREVQWMQGGPYYNSLSLSDPSRRDDHPFTIAYKSFCNKIRADFGRREFSAQIHSYDWDRHDNHADCQVSAGSGKYCPNLPIRDLSELHIDLINLGEHLIWPANSIGTHENVYLNDYYAVNYDLYDFYFYNWQGEPYPVNDQVDLPGYSNNRQMAYSFSNWNRFDVFEPFFHLEMDELPNSYDETEEAYHWFYGFDEISGEYDLDELFTNTIQYYDHWVDAMTQVLPQVLDLNDGETPLAPQNFVANPSDSESNINLEWDPISSFDFFTYEIQYADEPISTNNYEVLNRENNAILASPNHSEQQVNLSYYNTEYFFRLRAIDKNGNNSPFTEELSLYTTPVVISNFVAIGEDAQVQLHWIAEIQVGNQGFSIFRKLEGEEYELIASWETDPELLGSSIQGESFTYTDDSVSNDMNYTYKLSWDNQNGYEFFSQIQRSCQPQNIFKLFISNDDLIIDSVAFAKNLYATSGYDQYYDLPKEFTPQTDYIHAAFHEVNWNPNYMNLQREVYGEFDPFDTFYSYDLRIQTDLLNEPIQIELSSNFNYHFGKIYLRNEQGDQYINLQNNSHIFYPIGLDDYEFTLFWGLFKPIAEFGDDEEGLYLSEEVIEIDWSYSYADLIEYSTLSLISSTDSIQIANNLTNEVTEIAWTIPELLNLQNAHFVLDIHSIEDEVFRYTNENSIGIFQAPISLEYDAGWQTISNPWISEELSSEIVFGESSELLFPLREGQYRLDEQFEFGKGYWLNAESGGSFTHHGDIKRNSMMIDLKKGWNLISNPHLCSYHKKDLRFINNYHNYRFSYMAWSGRIHNSIFIYEDGNYESIDVIEPMQSFYIYSSMENDIDQKCIFTPYNRGYLNLPEPDWSISLTVSQTDSDMLILGTDEYAGVDFDSMLDNAQPPIKPREEQISIYSVFSDNYYDFTKLSSDFRESIGPDHQDSLIWNFEISCTEMESIILHLDLSQLPASLLANLQIENNIWQGLVNDVYNYSFLPSQVGMITSSLKIYTNTVDVNENLLSKTSLINYPNPFKPAATGVGRSSSTKIQFTVPTEGKVDLSIYNIKGQKIKTICNKILAAGDHKFTWFGKNSNNIPAASGIYFLKLQTEDNTKFRKILLLK